MTIEEVKNSLFYCYSPPLLQFLKERQNKYLHKGINEKTNKNFWVFVRDEQLDKTLAQYSELINQSK